MIVGREIYVEGRKTGSPGEPRRMREVCRARKGMAWIGLEEPTPEELDSVATEFGFHPLAVEDTMEAGQRPKTEKYSGTTFVVLRPVRYMEEGKVEFGEIHLFVGEDFVVTVRHGGTEPLDEVKHRLEDEPSLLALGPLAVLYAVADHVVDAYAPALDALENDIDEIEAEVFGEGANDSQSGKPGSPRSPVVGVSQRIYGLSREVMLLHRMTRPMVDSLNPVPTSSSFGKMDPEVRNYLRDVHDHAIRVNDRVEGLRELMSNVLSVNLAIIGTTQSDQNKKISAWAAILIVPTVVTGIYGMNFRFMPELGWRFGYPLTLVLMLCICVSLYALFRRRGWL